MTKTNDHLIIRNKRVFGGRQPDSQIVVENESISSVASMETKTNPKMYN